MSIISIDLAQKIVNAIKQICKCDINFINREGIIIASTNEKRINTFHEAGLKAIQTNDTIIVEDEQNYLGVKKGINSPIYIDGKAVSVIGVSGEPKEVKDYIFLAIKITEIFLAESILRQNLSNKFEQISVVMQTYLYNQVEKYNYMDKILDNLKVDKNCKYFVVTIISNDKNISIIEKDIKYFFNSLDCVLYTYIFPCEFVAFLEESKINKFKNIISSFCSEHKEIIKVGIGNVVSLEDINVSYKNSNIAIKYIKEEDGFKFYEDFSLEILLNSIPNELKQKYIENIISNLTKEDIQLLKVYFNNNMELKNTAKELFIHINTLQYKLDKIYKKIGFNPRLFKDANFIYIIIQFL